MASAQSLEEQLATIHLGHLVTPGDAAIIAQAGRLLDNLARTYPAYSQQEIADISVRAHQLLQAQGYPLRLLDFMGEADRARPIVKGGRPLYEETCATLITVLTQGIP